MCIVIAVAQLGQASAEHALRSSSMAGTAEVTLTLVNTSQSCMHHDVRRHKRKSNTMGGVVVPVP